MLPLVHSKESSAFYIKENDIIDRLDEEKLRKAGLEPSPIYGELKRRKSISFQGKELNPNKFNLINVPVTIYHGKNDSVVPLKLTRKRAEKLFLNLEHHVLDDDHMLHHTVKNIDWLSLIKSHS